MGTGYGDERDVAVSPSTIQPETFGTDDDQAPTMVWMPTAHAMRGEDIPPFVLRELDDGRLVMLAYTTQEAFVEGCGTQQPYVTVLTGAVQAFQHAVEADEVLWDAILHPVLRQRGERDGDGHPINAGEEGT